MSRRKDFIDSLLDGVSRMHRAAATQTEHQIRELLERGADPNVRNFRGETPLHRAAIRNPDLDVSRTLIGAGADVNAQDEKGATPLHRAAHNPSTGRAHLLIEAGADVGARDNSGATPLHHAAESGHETMIVRLVDAGADPNARDQAGGTPLRIAVEKAWPEGTKTLLNHGADPNVPDNEGQIPLHVAYADKPAGHGESGCSKPERTSRRVMGRAVFRSSTCTIRTTIGGAGNTSKKPAPTTAAKVPEQTGQESAANSRCGQSRRSRGTDAVAPGRRERLLSGHPQIAARRSGSEYHRQGRADAVTFGGGLHRWERGG